MRYLIDLQSTTSHARILLFCILILLQGCAGLNTLQKSIPLSGLPLQEKVETNTFNLPQGVDVIGQPAYLQIENGDTLPDIARHFSLGVNALGAANPGVDLWVPAAGEQILLPLHFILPETPRKGIVINLAALRLFHYKEKGKSLIVTTYPVGVGTTERPSPTGRMRVERKVPRPTWYVPASIAEDHRKKGDILPPAVLPGPLNPLGEYALYLSKPSYLIHGTNKPASIGLRATNGCTRLYPEDIKKLYESTPVGTPVYVVDQPFLVGKRGGTVYLEAHAPSEMTDPREAQNMYAKLKNIEKQTGRALDWNKVKKIITEARGIPIAVAEIQPGGAKAAPAAVRVKHPVKLSGKPEMPKLKAGAWYVLVSTSRDKTDALRMGAIVNHQGPPIPARVLAKNGSYHVIAGPFATLNDANNAKKQLKIDLELDALLIEPSLKK